jgi:methylenetetrahydrofolate dehydrogenase (NADP+) / methenyltetrahydrofolate cyclohydrolase
VAAQIIDGKAIAERLRHQIAKQAADFTAQHDIVPHLAAVLVGDDPASAVYVRNKERMCQKVGLGSTLHKLPPDTTQQQLLDLIGHLNNDIDVHGILVQLPLPDQIDPTTVLDAVTPLKDVDCFHPENVGLLAQGRPRFQPCTPAGCQHLLRESGIQTRGKHVVVLGRSDIVGKPMALLMMQRGEDADATVTVCHSRTQHLADITRQADIVIAAIGQPKFVTAEMLKPGVVVIDVGIHRREDGSLCGDVDFEPVSRIAGAITPVPGGVGPMTIAMLLANTLTAAQTQRGSRPDG